MHTLPPTSQRGEGKRETERVRNVNHKPATSAGNWMALICISSCIIHQHHFTTVRNITFILQMLIYVKQLIWETSESSSIKDPATFIFFCLHECDSICIWTHTRPLPFWTFICVCVCVWACVHLCLDSWSRLYLTQPHGSYLPVRSRCDLNDGSTHNCRVTILIHTFLPVEMMKEDWAQKLNEALAHLWLYWQCNAKTKQTMQCKYLSTRLHTAILKGYCTQSSKTGNFTNPVSHKIMFAYN